MITRIEDGFFELLQSEVIMTIDGKKYRGGKFMNFRIKDLFIQIDLIVKGKQRHVDIPIPYEARPIDNGLELSYKFDDMSDFGDEVDRLLKSAIGGGKSKLYNKCLHITRVYDDE